MLDIRAIERILPHRYPFLLVDRVDEIGDDKIVARKLVSRNEPHFNGHFPGHPVMPGVLIIEALAQAGALLAAQLVGFDPATQVIYFMAIDKARFRKPVVPGRSADAGGRSAAQGRGDLEAARRGEGRRRGRGGGGAPGFASSRATPPPRPRAKARARGLALAARARRTCWRAVTAGRCRRAPTAPRW